MNTKIYAMEQGFLSKLLDDRREIWALARTFKNAEEMRQAREDFMAQVSAINITPRNPDEAKKSYTIDADGNAHIPIVGELTPRASTDVCGAYTAEALTEYGFIIAAAQSADADEEVGAVVFDIDSPGGYVDGVAEAANAIRMIWKPTSSNVYGMAASAAYWLASQTDKIVANSIGARIGSIGVAVESYDDTKMLENAGITRRVFTSTDAPDKRLDLSNENDQVKLVSTLDDLHNLFASSVAEGRGVSVETVNKDYGRGAVLLAEQALTAGMIDEVKTYHRRDVIDPVEDSAGVASEGPAAKAESIKEGAMDIKALETEHADVFASAVEIGVKKERERQRALDEQLEADPKNPKLAEVIAKAKADGKTVPEINTQIMVAIRDGKLSGENPPDVETAESLDNLSAEDIQAAKIAGMSLEEYRRFMRKEA